MKSKIIVGTRKSKLALAQTQMVVEQLHSLSPDFSIEVQEIVTEGDRNQTDSLQKIGGKGIFVKEIEKHLLNGDIDIAVHSLKDVMTVLPDELILGAFLRRDSPFDCLISRTQFSSIQDLPHDARIGTNSTRRTGQVLAIRPDITIVPIRGNVDTRLKKLDTEHLDGVILAEAGTNRLHVDLSVYHVLSLQNVIVPAVGQGVMAVECRQADADMQAILKPLDDQQTRANVAIERSFMRELGGSCNFPIGGFSRYEGNQQLFTGLIAATDGSHVLRRENVVVQNANVGVEVADQLLQEDTFNIIEGK